MRDDARQAPVPDLADRLIALRRRTAAPARRRERSPEPVAGPSTPSRNQPAPQSRRTDRPSRPRRSPSPNEFDRRLAPNARSQRLFDPNAPTTRSIIPQPLYRDGEDSEISSTAPVRRVQPRHAQSPRGPPPAASTPHNTHTNSRQSASSRQLFDPSRHDPMSFARQGNPHSSSSSSVLPIPVGGSATSTDASSTFTLSSTTDASSVDSNPLQQRKKEDSGPFVEQLKRIYREISVLEKRLLAEGEYYVPPDDADDMPVRVQGVSESVDERWMRLIELHKQLAESDLNLLTLATNPTVPASVQSIPERYNIPTRLWTIAFHRMITSLRRASNTLPTAIEHLTDFIYYAYRFYTGLLEEPHLQGFHGKWLEALGDLASYRMAVAIQVAKDHAPESPPSPAPEGLHTLPIEPPSARIDDSPVPSIGVKAAAEFDDDERETWRATARNWYALALKDTPGAGRLQYHMGSLSRDAKGEELRAVYHFLKSLVAVHPFDSGREAVLGFFSPARQQLLSAPTASATSLFLHMQGLLFTRIDLDQVLPTLARFLERLELDVSSADGSTTSESDWVMMGVLAVGSMLEYGRADSRLRKATSSSSSASKTKPDEGDMEEEEDQDPSHLSRPMQALSTTLPDESAFAKDLHVFNLSLDVTFTTLSYLLRNPYMPRSRTQPLARPPINPFITIILTFVSTLLKNPTVLSLIERHVPWVQLSDFFSAAVQRTGGRAASSDEGARVVNGQLLPEDWCLRGMHWAARRLYDRGFWKAPAAIGSSAINGEMDVIAPHIELALEEEEDLIDVEEMDWEPEHSHSMQSRQERVNAMDTVALRRWKRVRVAAEVLIRAVDGIEFDGEAVCVTGPLAERVADWEEEKRREAEEEEARRRRVFAREDEEEMAMGDDEDLLDEDEDDSPEDSEEIRELKARRRYLRSLIKSSGQGSPDRPSRSVPRKRHAKYSAPSRPVLHVLPGYTILVIDTNILLSSLSVVSSLVDSKLWTIIVPLAVITELDGLAKNSSPLGTAASEAISYLAKAVPTHSTTLKVQTSRGNYLHTLSVRSEQVDFKSGASQDRNMDDLILRSAVWQAEHFVDRTYASGESLSLGDDEDEPMTGALSSSVPSGTSKVVVLSFDRNLRLKARSRKLDAADEKDMAAILAVGS